MITVRMEKRKGGNAKEESAKLDHLRVRRGHRGHGYSVEHHSAMRDGFPQSPSSHHFGSDEGLKMLAHVARHMNVDWTHGTGVDKGQIAEDQVEPDEAAG